MADVVAIDGGDGTPPEPNWRSIFGRAADRTAASAYWREVISELKTAEKLAVANSHSIKRLVVAYVSYDRCAKEVAKSGPVMKAPKTGVPTYSPWWSTMNAADSQASALEKALCITPRDRGTGAKVAKKARQQAGGGYLKSRG